MDVLQSIEEMGQVHVPFRLKMKFGFEVCNGMKNFRCGGHFVEILLVQDCTCVSYHDNKCGLLLYVKKNARQYISNIGTILAMIIRVRNSIR